MAIAKAMVAGRLVRDPECQYGQSGTARCTFTLAVQDGYGDNEHCSFIECTVFRPNVNTLWFIRMR